jgi:hypothetical protein
MGEILHFKNKLSFLKLVRTLIVPFFASKFENEIWNLNVFCHSDWDEDPETRIGVTWFIVYLMSIPVCKRSKSQRGVILSSNEEEYVTISEAFKEIKFIYFLLCDIRIDIELPFVKKTEYIGARSKMDQRAYTHFTWIFGIIL